MAVVEISVAPLGTATPGVSEYVAACVEIVAASGLKYQLTPMGTVIEGEIDAVLPVCAACMRFHLTRARKECQP
jgi:uncharacterized protein (TIGR00106 family)